VFDEYGAALVLGLSRELSIKWRQHGIGPDYIQYGKNGPIDTKEANGQRIR
jgi:hypothetical protein